MWIARDKNNKLYLWSILPIRAIERFNNCSKEFKKIELKLHNKIHPFERFEEGREFWTFPNEVTEEEYIGPEEYILYSSKYKLEIDSNYFPELHWEDEPVEITICLKN